LAQLTVVVFVLPPLYVLAGGSRGARVCNAGAALSFVFATGWILDRVGILANPTAPAEEFLIGHPWWIVLSLDTRHHSGHSPQVPPSDDPSIAWRRGTPRAASVKVLIQYGAARPRRAGAAHHGRGRCRNSSMASRARRSMEFGVASSYVASVGR
jgi:hypothetical protein